MSGGLQSQTLQTSPGSALCLGFCNGFHSSLDHVLLTFLSSCFSVWWLELTSPPGPSLLDRPLPMPHLDSHQAPMFSGRQKHLCLSHRYCCCLFAVRAMIQPLPTQGSSHPRGYTCIALSRCLGVACSLSVASLKVHSFPLTGRVLTLIVCLGMITILASSHA